MIKFPKEVVRKMLLFGSRFVQDLMPRFDLILRKTMRAHANARIEAYNNIQSLINSWVLWNLSLARCCIA
jgi:hypothetical protein